MTPSLEPFCLPEQRVVTARSLSSTGSQKSKNRGLLVTYEADHMNRNVSVYTALLGSLLFRRDICTILARDLHCKANVPSERRRTKSIITTVVARLEAFRKYNRTFGDFPSRALFQMSKVDFLVAPS